MKAELMHGYSSQGDILAVNTSLFTDRGTVLLSSGPPGACGPGSQVLIHRGCVREIKGICRTDEVNC